MKKTTSLHSLVLKFAMYSVWLVLLVGILLLPQTALAVNTDPASTVGKITTPPGVRQYQAASGADIGIIFFLSNMIKLFTIVCSIYALINVFLAATNFLTASADASATEKARTQITNAVIGLFLIVMAFTFTALAGLIFFRDAGIFLNPKITGP